MTLKIKDDYSRGYDDGYMAGVRAEYLEIERLRGLLRIREHLESAEVDAVEEIANKEAEIDRLRLENQYLLEMKDRYNELVERIDGEKNSKCNNL